MLARVQSFLMQGIDAHPCEVEVDVDQTGDIKQAVVGLPDAGVKEAIERVRAAITNAGFEFPIGRVLINLAPADVKKEGPVYDLPIAVGLLANVGAIPTGRVGSLRKNFDRPGGEGERSGGAHAAGLSLAEYLVAGELALDGRVRTIKGAIALASLAKTKGYRGVILPADNAVEASLVAGVEAIGVRTLSELVGVLSGQLEAIAQPPPDVGSLLAHADAPIDFREVRGQEGAKRALVVAAAGGHNILGFGSCVRHGRGRRGGVRLRAVGHNAAALWAGGGDGSGARRGSLTDGLPLDG